MNKPVIHLRNISERMIEHNHPFLKIYKEPAEQLEKRLARQRAIIEAGVSLDYHIEKVKERKKDVNQCNHNADANDNKPINDALDHLNRIEGYPTKKFTRMNDFPLPICIIGYLLIGFMALGFLAVIILNFR